MTPLAVEVGFYVEIEHPVMAPTALTSSAHGVDRRFAGPVAIGVGMERRLQTRLQVATGNFLSDTVSNSWNAQRARTLSEYPRVAPAEESSSLTTAGSRAHRGCL